MRTKGFETEGRPDASGRLYVSAGSLRPFAEGQEAMRLNSQFIPMLASGGFVEKSLGTASRFQR
jgi:hypothetical protein